MPFSPKTLEEKPYNQCVICDHLGSICDGPNFLAMTTERWCEWCRLRKEQLGIINAEIADASGVSKVSVDRIIAGAAKDIRLSTMQAITRVLVNGSWGKHPCALSAMPPEVVYQDRPELLADLREAQESCKRLQEKREDDARKIDFLKKQVEFKESQMLAKDRLMQDRAAFLHRKDRVITILGILLGIAVALIIAALIADAAMPEVGYFWRG